MDGQELSRRERGRLWLRLAIRVALTAAAVGLFARFGPPLFSLFMPFLLAFAAAWLLNPLVRVIQRHLGVSRKLLSFLLIFLILASAVGLVAAFVWNVVTETLALANSWPDILAAAQDGVHAVGSFFDRLLVLLPASMQESVWSTLNSLANHLLTWLGGALPNLVTVAAQAATRAAKGVPSFAVATVVFLMGSYYLTADYPHILYLLTHRLNERVRHLLGEIRTAAVTAFGGYVKAELILSIGVFFILLVGFSVIRQNYALLLALLLAVLDFIPIVGAGTIMIPWAVIDLVLGSFRHAVELMVIWGVIVLFRRVMEPRTVGDQTGLPPVVSLISIYVGMRLGGVLGMILAPVVCLVVRNICRLGIFAPFLADLRLAVSDTAAFLRNRPGGENSKNM